MIPVNVGIPLGAKKGADPGQNFCFITHLASKPVKKQTLVLMSEESGSRTASQRLSIHSHFDELLVYILVNKSTFQLNKRTSIIGADVKF